MSEDDFFSEDLNTALLELLDDLVGDRGRVGAAEFLGVNYRTLQHCLVSRRLSRRMREALEQYRSSAPVVVDLPADAEETGPGEKQGRIPGAAGGWTWRVKTGRCESLLKPWPDSWMS